VEPITETNGKSKTKNQENGENTYNAWTNYETWITYRLIFTAADRAVTTILLLEEY